jgi:hypothetical protein
VAVAKKVPFFNWLDVSGFWWVAGFGVFGFEMVGVRVWLHNAWIWLLAG